MKTLVSFVCAVLFLAAFSQITIAQQGPGPAIQEETGKEITPEQFQERKAQILKMIEERRAKLDQAKACVEAATDAAALRKCRPERPMGMGPMGRGGRTQGGPGWQQPPQSPAQEPQ